MKKVALLIAIALFPAVSLAQSAASAGRFVSLRVTGTTTLAGVTASSSSASFRFTSPLTITASDDVAFVFKVTNQMDGTAGVHTDSIAQFISGSNTVYDMKASGQLNIFSQSNNGQAGLRFRTPSSGSDFYLRTSGGNGEIVSFFSNTTTINEFDFGHCPATDCVLRLGPNANGASPEIILYKGTNGPAALFNVPIRPAVASLATCASATEGNISRDTLAGGTTGHRTRVCLCTSNGAGTPAYAWQNVVSGTVGTTSTCSD